MRRLSAAFPYLVPARGLRSTRRLGQRADVRPRRKQKITPYFTFQTSFLEALQDPSIIYELGVKYYFIGHHSNITLNWRNRPVFGSGDVDPAGETVFVPSTTQQSRANEIILQLMVYL